jgi:copper chaperone CopZ
VKARKLAKIRRHARKKDVVNLNLFITGLFPSPGGGKGPYSDQIMKTIIFYCLFLLAFIPASAQFSKAEMQASGLTCSMCSNAINKSLRTLSFVENVNTDLNKNQFELTFKATEKVDFDQLRKKVEDAGFSVANFWVFTSFDNQKIGENEQLSVGGLNLRFVNVKDQTLNGEHKIKLVDKNFILAKEYRKYARKIGESQAGGERWYHVTI